VMISRHLFFPLLALWSGLGLAAEPVPGAAP